MKGGKQQLPKEEILIKPSEPIFIEEGEKFIKRDGVKYYIDDEGEIYQKGPKGQRRYIKSIEEAEKGAEEFKADVAKHLPEDKKLISGALDLIKKGDSDKINKFINTFSKDEDQKRRIRFVIQEMKKRGGSKKRNGGKALSRAELMKRAKTKGIKGRSKMNIAQLRKSLKMKPLKR